MKDRSLKAEARAETTERVFEDILNELGCERNNEEALQAIAELRRERDRIADELDTMNNNHRIMAKLLADTGRERDEAREALTRRDAAEKALEVAKRSGAKVHPRVAAIKARAITEGKP
jgi:aspartate oxidase